MLPLPVPHSRSINSNFEADVLETQAKLGKMLMIFVISISKLTKKAMSDEEVRGAYSDRLLVSYPQIMVLATGLLILKAGILFAFRVQYA